MEFIRTNPAISTGFIFAASSFAYDKFFNKDPEKDTGIVGPFIGGVLTYKLVELVSGAEPLTGVLVALLLNTGGKTYMVIK